MNVSYDSFARASTLLHCLQGAAFLLLGAAEVYDIQKQGRRAELVGPLAMCLAGVLGFVVILALPGGWDVKELAAALTARSGFYIFLSFSCLFAAAGLSRLMQHLIRPVHGWWQNSFLLFTAAIGVLYFTLAWRVNEEARWAVFVAHAGIGGALLLAVLAQTVYIFSGLRVLRVCWAVLLLAAAVQLLAYREPVATFGLRSVTLNSGPQPSPAQTQSVPSQLNIKNAGPSAKKRSGN